MPLVECRWSVDLPSRSLSPEADKPKPLMSGMHCSQGQVRPMVTFPAIKHHYSLTDTNSYCLVTDRDTCMDNLIIIWQFLMCRNTAVAVTRLLPESGAAGE